MPDFTRISAAEQDIERKVNASTARAMILQRAQDLAGWDPIRGFWNEDGVLKKWWAPYDFNDGIHLRIRMVEMGPITETILKKIDAFAYWQDYKKHPERAYVFAVEDVEYPEIFSKREWTFLCQKLEPFVPGSRSFDYTFDFTLG